ncbi:MAG TPA: hypothetical protein VGK40_03935 [Verrucomicrobiae bacterium]
MRHCAFALVCLATLIALFYAVENWRGRRAFAKVKQEAEARGLKLDWDGVVPPPIPDEQNAAAHPFLRPMLDFVRTPSGRVWNDSNAYERLQLFRTDLVTNALGKRVDDKGWPPRLWVLGTTKPTPWTEWQAYYRAGTNYPVPENPGAPAADVLFALRRLDEDFAQLAEAVKRPAARYAIKYDEPNPAGILLPHLAQVKTMTQSLRLRSAARLEAGDPNGAFEDTMTGLRLADTLRGDPLLMNFLYHIACVAVMESSMAEGLARHQWNDDQLRALQEQLQKTDFLGHCQLAMRGEMVGFGVRLIDYLEAHRPEMGTIFEFDPSDGNQSPPRACAAIGWRLMPAGWFEQNKVATINVYLHHYLPQLDVEHRRIRPASNDESDAFIKQLPRGPNTILVRLLLPALDKAFARCARAQATADQAVMACALERFHRENKRYPDALAQLIPKFLAKPLLDPITGELQKYRLTLEGSYVLYSIGLDGKDDGGSSVKVEREPQDWVWQLPAHE